MHQAAQIEEVSASAKLSEAEKMRIAEKTLDRQIAWINAADNKITALFAFQSGSVALLASKSSQFLRLFQTHQVDGWSIVVLALAIVFAVFLTRSFLYSFRTLYPHVKSSYKSLIFFGTIPDNREEFQNGFFDLTKDQMQQDMSANIVTTAHIARRKFHYIKYSIQSFIVAGACGALLLVLLSANL